jgi:tryptophan 2,3-dioxygenase
MTPLDFLEFRNLLPPSSGFQSRQFRLIEAKLGLQLDKRHQKDYYKRTNEGGFTKDDYNTINQVEEEKNLLQLVADWLERMPFFEDRFWKNFPSIKNIDYVNHPFWNNYHQIYQTGLTERESAKIHDFDYALFDQKNNFTEEQLQNIRSSFSAKAMRAALFIMLYRDFPVFQTSYQILDSLIEIDHLLSNWRHKHIIMVRRMIGMRVGTGNTSGAGYLEGALSKHYVYRDLSSLSTYLIERKKLPNLPDELIRHLGFSL